MPITKFTKNMSIISALDDEPNEVGGLTAAELKAKFDEGGVALKEYINTVLIPALENLGIETTVQLPTEAGFKYMRLNSSGTLEVSQDGQSWETVGGSLPAGSVLYNSSQTLSDTQKSTARSNIGAVSSSDVTEAINTALGDYPAALAAMDAVIGGAGE